MRRNAFVMTFNRLIVSAYKVLGFVILTGILVWLGSYVFMNVFYLFNRSWIAPTVISASDNDVRDLNSDIAHTLAQRDKLISERRELQAKMDDAARTHEAEVAFQDMYKRAIRSDLADRKETSEKLDQLLVEYRKAKTDIVRSNQAYAALSEERMKQLHEVKLIDDDGMVAASHQIAEMTNANVSLMQKTADLEHTLSGLRREVKALAAAATGDAGGTLSYDILATRREFDKSVVESKRAEAAQGALADSLAAIDASISRYDGLADGIRQSPFLLAGDKNFLIAFVPYDNLDHAPPNAAIFRCAFGPVWCEKIGRTGEALGGEVVRRHAFHNKEMRGRFVRIHLDDPDAARRGVLYVGRAPLFI